MHERRRLLSYLEERFGIPRSLFSGFRFFRSRKGWTLLHDTGHLESAGRLKVAKTGIKAFHRVSAYVKPTTRLIQIFGGAATRAKVEIGEEALKALAEGGEILRDLDLESGYVILALQNGAVIGMGFYHNGRIRSQISRKQLRP